MAKNNETEATVRVVLQGGEPYVESRFRPLNPTEDGPIPKGKILVVRAPLDPNAGDDEMESELIDDDGSDEAFCPECAAGGHGLPDRSQFVPVPPPPPFRGGPSPSRRKFGRNDPCPCGSGRKYKRCCLN